MATIMRRYNHRQLLPREADYGYAIALARDAGAFIERRENEYALFYRGKRRITTSDVRELTRMLKELLASETVHQLE